MRLSRRSALTLIGASSWLLRGARVSAASTTAGLPQGVTPDGHHYLGRVDAPVTMIEYGDFL
jgi:hypothetical protein